ncbi:MAG: hypothetical protein Q9163_006201 [Psora crenata]
MKKVVMGRMGGWVDWVVGWMDFKGEGEEEDDGAYDDDEGDGDGLAGTMGLNHQQDHKGLDLEEVRRRLRDKKERIENADGDGGDEEVSVPPPPQGQEAGLLTDVKWLLGVASRIAL